MTTRKSRSGVTGGSTSGVNNGARICPQCGAAFVCSIAAGASRCWCFELPSVMAVRADTTCLCPACLTEAIRRAQEVQ